MDTITMSRARLSLFFAQLLFASAALRIRRDHVQDIPPGSEARAMYISTFLADLVRALGLADPSRVSVLSVTSGSIVITFSISSPTDDAAALILAQIQALLEAQLVNPNSPLLTGDVTENINVDR